MIYKTLQGQNFISQCCLPKQNFDKWSSSETTQSTNITKEEFDKTPVLERFKHQLKTLRFKHIKYYEA